MASVARGDGYEEIVQLIRSLKVGSGQSLRQVQVPDSAYKTARTFLKWAPNVLVDRPSNTKVPLRFKVLYDLGGNESIYRLLIVDAGNTPLAQAQVKINDWKDATKSLLRYALNLKLAPKRPEFQRMKVGYL